MSERQHQHQQRADDFPCASALPGAGKCFDEKNHVFDTHPTRTLQPFSIFIKRTYARECSSRFLIRLSCIAILEISSEFLWEILEWHQLGCHGSSIPHKSAIPNCHPSHRKIYGSINRERPPTPTQGCGQKWGLV